MELDGVRFELRNRVSASVFGLLQSKDRTLTIEAISSKVYRATKRRRLAMSDKIQAHRSNEGQG